MRTCLDSEETNYAGHLPEMRRPTLESTKAKEVTRTPELVQCRCGCGRTMTETDDYGRPRFYIHGHHGRKYEDPKQYKREYNHRNRRRRHAWRWARRRKLKVKLILLRGGKCEWCEMPYNGKNAAIFQFHHSDRLTKEFAAGNQLCNYSWKRILAEVAKCEMICTHCHILEHSEPF